MELRASMSSTKAPSPACRSGTYEIPPVEFVYYDTGSNSYKTIKTQAFTLNVAKGTGGSAVSDYTGQEDVEQLNKDIRYIKTGDASVHDIDEFFFGSVGYWVAICVLAAIFVSLFVVFRHRAIANANIDLVRGKKANKVATKRLKKASRLMNEGKASQFYDEVLRAIPGGEALAREHQPAPVGAQCR